MSNSNVTKLCVLALALLLVNGCSDPLGMGPSDEKLIKGTMTEWKAANKAKDIDRIMNTISENYVSFMGGGKQSMRDFLTGAIDRGFMDNVEINIKDAESTIEDDKAKFGPVKFIGERGPFVIYYKLQKEGNKWLIIGTERPEQ